MPQHHLIQFPVAPRKRIRVPPKAFEGIVASQVHALPAAITTRSGAATAKAASLGVPRRFGPATVLRRTTLATNTAVPTRSPGLASAFIVGAISSILGSAGYISQNKPLIEDAYLNAISFTAGVLATIGLLLLTFGLLRWRTTLPNWAILLSAAGLWFAGWQAIDSVTTLPAIVALEEIDTETFMGAMTWYVMAAMVVKSVCCLVGFVTLGVAGLKQGSIPKSAAILLILAGLASIIPPYPPGLIAFSVAALLISRSGIQTRS